MLTPEIVADDKKKSQMFMRGIDNIRGAFNMDTAEGLYLMGRIFEIIKFEMLEKDK